MLAENEVYKRLLLDLAQERTVDGILRLIVTRLNGQSHLALSRIWLVGPSHPLQPRSQP